MAMFMFGLDVMAGWVAPADNFKHSDFWGLTDDDKSRIRASAVQGPGVEVLDCTCGNEAHQTFCQRKLVVRTYESGNALVEVLHRNSDSWVEYRYSATYDTFTEQ